MRFFLSLLPLLLLGWVSTSSATPTTTTPIPARFDTSNEIHHHEKFHPVEFLSHHAVEDRQQFIVNLTREAWHYYVDNRWGSDRGRTILAAMPTLWLMDLKEEFAKGREWVKEKLEGNRTVLQEGRWVSSTVGEYIGSLLSCYALTGDQLFLDRAKEIADRLDSSYNFTVWNRPELEREGEKKSKAVDEWSRSHLEYTYLSRLTGNDKYLERIHSIDRYLKSINYVDSHLKVEMLAAKIKSYIQSNGTKPEYLSDYLASLSKAEHVTELIQKTKSGLTYLSRGLGHMNDNDCQLGAILSLGSDVLEGNLARNQSISSGKRAQEERLIAKHRELAGNITETCHFATNGTRTGLTPTTFQILKDRASPQESVKGLGEYLFEPELAESYLVLYRDTHEEKYRDWAWELTKAIFDNTRLEAGKYAGVKDVQEIPVKSLNRRSVSQIFRGTFKYLYLIYSPEERLPFEQWVLTLAGHPLPVLDRKTKK